MKVTRIRLKNYRGVAQRELDTCNSRLPAI